MKQEKFEKVVEWEKEPIVIEIIFGLFMVFIGLLNLIFVDLTKGYAFIAGFIVGYGVYLINDSFGKGEKSYWRKIK